MVMLVRSGLIILVVLLAATTASLPASYKPRLVTSALAQPLGPSTHRTYWLRGGPGSSNWNGTFPGPGLNASDGDVVSILLQSVDGNTHSWFLDFNNNFRNDTNEAATVSPDFTSTSTWTNFTFTASLGVTIPHGGNFLYECRQHPGFMNGNFKFVSGPLASFTHSPLTPLTRHPVLFNASASWPSTGDTITNYSWNFGDLNTTSSGNSPTITHAYVSNSTYTVKLTVSDSGSGSAQASSMVTVLSSFDYQVTVAPTTQTIVAGDSISAVVHVALTTGSTQNITLSSSITPKDSFVEESLDTSSGSPPFDAVLHINTARLNLCVLNVCADNRTYTITIMATSGTGQNQNATFTLILKPYTSTYDYTPLIAAGIAGVLVIAAIFLVYRYRQRKPRTV